MRIRVRLFASVRERAGAAELELELPAGSDVASAKRALLELRPAIRSLEGVRGALRSSYVEDHAPLAEGDELALLPPVSGGAPDRSEDLERGVFELSSRPIDARTCELRVADPSAGATVVFVGSTRDHHRGRAVVRLEYEAFEAMTGPEMSRIFERCRAAFGDPSGADRSKALRILCVHRTGVVEVGEPSVVIAVASPHRAAAFDACRFLIDELKRSLPVWKKEFYVGGEHWVGDRS